MLFGVNSGNSTMRILFLSVFAGLSGAVGGIIRQVPSNVFAKPVILATTATSNVLEGVKNQVAPESRKEVFYMILLFYGDI